MSLLDFVKKQFIDVISWNEPGDGILAYRFPVADQEIQNGAKLTVRESQLSLFVNEGVVADLFKPGLYTLTTQTLPVLTSLKNWDKLFKSPFKSDVYFFSTREQINQRWGTPTPITVRDKELGPVRLRAFGTYAYRIKDPQIFFTKISGTRETYPVEDLHPQLGAAVVTNMASVLGSSAVPFVDMAANQSRFSDTLKTALVATFAAYGLELTAFFVQSLSLPEELQAHLDKVASMTMLGDLKRYAQFQTAEAIPTAAANPGGAAGAGMGLAAGLAMGQQMVSAMGGTAGAAPAAGGDSDPLVLIDKLHELLTKGVLTQAEFDTKKAELLRKIT